MQIALFGLTAAAFAFAACSGGTSQSPNPAGSPAAGFTSTGSGGSSVSTNPTGNPGSSGGGTTVSTGTTGATGSGGGTNSGSGNGSGFGSGTGSSGFGSGSGGSSGFGSGEGSGFGSGSGGSSGFGSGEGSGVGTTEANAIQCGAVRCAIPAFYCLEGDLPDGGARPTPTSCAFYPTPCKDNPTCECLGPISPGCTCTDEGGGNVTLDCPM